MMSWIGLHKFAGIIFGITQELLYITPGCVHKYTAMTAHLIKKQKKKKKWENHNNFVTNWN